MLLRSSSTPILNSWFPQNYYPNNPNSSPNNINELSLSPSRTNSKSTRTTSSPSSSPSPSPGAIDHSKPATCTRFDIDLQDPPWPNTTRLQWLFSSSGLNEVVSVAEDGAGSGILGGDGKGMDGGGHGHGGGGCGSGFNDYSSNNNAHERMEAYYQKLIKANPRDPLLLGNYAKFLKEVRGDLGKAEECCGRAIIGSPSDANLLSMYADIIWRHRRDAQRADIYFHQAIQAAPDDCYVHASYAKFLWDVEEEEVGDKHYQEQVGNESASPPSCMEGTSHGFPLTTI